MRAAAGTRGPAAVGISEGLCEDRRILVYVNGDECFSGKYVMINVQGYHNFEEFLSDLSVRISKDACIPHGIKKIFTPRGRHRVLSVKKIQDGSTYVCAGPEPFRNLNYGKNEQRAYLGLKRPGNLHLPLLQKLSAGMGQYTSPQQRQQQQNQQQLTITPLPLRYGVGGLPPRPVQNSGGAGEKFPLIFNYRTAVKFSGICAANANRTVVLPKTLRLLAPDGRTNGARMITVVRTNTQGNAKTAIRVMVSRRGVQTLGQVLCEISEAFGPRWTNDPLRHLYNLTGREVRSVNELFKQQKVFIGTGIQRIFGPNSSQENADPCVSGGTAYVPEHVNQPFKGDDIRILLEQFWPDHPDPRTVAYQWEKRLSKSQETEKHMAEVVKRPVIFKPLTETREFGTPELHRSETYTKTNGKILPSIGAKHSHCGTKDEHRDSGFEDSSKLDNAVPPAHKTEDETSRKNLVVVKPEGLLEEKARESLKEKSHKLKKSGQDKGDEWSAPPQINTATRNAPRWDVSLNYPTLLANYQLATNKGAQRSSQGNLVLNEALRQPGKGYLHSIAYGARMSVVLRHTSGTPVEKKLASRVVSLRTFPHLCDEADNQLPPPKVLGNGKTAATVGRGEALTNIMSRLRPPVLPSISTGKQDKSGVNTVGSSSTSLVSENPIASTMAASGEENSTLTLSSTQDEQDRVESSTLQAIPELCSESAVDGADRTDGARDTVSKGERSADECSAHSNSGASAPNSVPVLGESKSTRNGTLKKANLRVDPELGCSATTRPKTNVNLAHITAPTGSECLPSTTPLPPSLHSQAYQSVDKMHSLRTSTDHQVEASRLISVKKSANQQSVTAGMPYVQLPPLNSPAAVGVDGVTEKKNVRNSKLPLKWNVQIQFVNDPDFFQKRYHIGQILGDGNFAVVKFARNRATGEVCAMKIVDKNKIKGKEVMLNHEISIMHQCRHPNIVQLFEEFETPKEVYLAMEYVKDGDLFDGITKSVKFSEPTASGIVADLANALFYLHCRFIVHRDLKPENVLLWRQLDGKLRAKLADFGLALEVRRSLHTVCGTPTYIAPEILNECGYGLEVDMWALGVITYIMLCGFAPFRSPDRHQSKLFESIKRGVFVFLSPYWDNVSKAAKDLISRLLVVEPKHRLSAAQTLIHPWIFCDGQVNRVKNPQEMEARRQALRSELEREANDVLGNHGKWREDRMSQVPDTQISRFPSIATEYLEARKSVSNRLSVCRQAVNTTNSNRDSSAVHMPPICQTPAEIQASPHR
ncbi:unnamed protein product [Calicophoron daubneyi]|uniref:non-specific serine/threonine protein kinase n=1 Tax=Calicophoron daubneyi TaxID=300641 RepID=A0AAV2TRK2_CALDB